MPHSFLNMLYNNRTIGACKPYSGGFCTSSRLAGEGGIPVFGALTYSAKAFIASSSVSQVTMRTRRR
jgi:hypothetical protein